MNSDESKPVTREAIDHAYVTAYHKCKTEVFTTLEQGGPVEFKNPHDAGIDAVYALIQGKEES